MATLIAVDGHSLNYGLQRIAQTRNEERRSRFRIDYQRLADLLAKPDTANTVSLRFYTDDQKVEQIPQRPMGRVVKYFVNKGYGFIAGTDGQSYFFHHNEIANKRALCSSHEERYPHPLSQDFKDRIMNKVVSYSAVPNEDGRFKADSITIEVIEKNIDRYYQLRRQPFLEMLEDSGYKLVRCRPSNYAVKSKNISCRVVLDSLTEMQKGDRFVLLSDDPIFIDLLEKLHNNGIAFTVATFKIARSTEIVAATQNLGGQLLYLDDHLDSIAFEYDDDEDETTEVLLDSNPAP